MFGKWQLTIKLAKMSKYIESRFSTCKSTEDTSKADKYPPPNEGMVHMVLAPTMGRIKSIWPQEVGTLLTKAWIQKLANDSKNRPHVTVALSYLEYLVRLQHDYEDMEKRYNVVVKKQEFLHMSFYLDTQYYQLALLQEQAEELIKSWPIYNMHVQSKCEPLAHPIQVQILDMVEGYRFVEADAKSSIIICKLHTPTLAQMQIPLGMLLNP